MTRELEIAAAPFVAWGYAQAIPVLLPFIWWVIPTAVALDFISSMREKSQHPGREEA